MLKIRLNLKKFLPGFITGAADDDVSGIGTYSIVGATTGYAQLWLLLLSTPLLIVVQGMCARIGDVLKMGLGRAIKIHFGFKVALVASMALLLANIVTIAADFAVMAAVLNMLFPQIPSYYFLFFLAIVIWYLVVFKSYNSLVKVLLLAASVLGTYVLAGLLAKPDWILVIKNTFLPQIQPTVSYFMASTALLGTTITPYLFYWQTSEEVEEHRSVQAGRESFKLVIPGMIYSNIVAYFIIAATATVLYTHGITNLETAQEAAEALRPLAGDLAYLLFAIGVLGAGLLAIPVLAASSSYAIAETFGWREGLNQTIHKARGFYAVLTMTFLVSLLIIFSPINPIKALFYSQILVGILAPLLLILIFLIASSGKIMGSYKNSFISNLIALATIAIMLLSVGGLFWSFLK